MTIDFAQMRFNMIEQQVRPWGVLDAPTLRIIDRVPREQFVPDAYRGLAYADIEIPCGNDPSQVMLPPRIVGHLLQAVAIQPGERVLEIGTGSGYVTACCAQCGAQVTSIDIDNDLIAAANARLIAQQYTACTLVTADVFATHEYAGSPFDVIALTGSLPTPAPLTALYDHLTIGGRVFAIIGQAPLMHAYLFTRLPTGQIQQRTLIETSIPPLIHAPLPETFVF